MALPKRKRDKLLSDSHRHAPKQESIIAKRIKGDVVNGSGCGYRKGDVRVEGIIRIEAKCTQHKSYSLTRKLVEYIEMAALQDGEVPAFQIDFLTGDKVDHQLAVIPVWALELLISNQEAT